METQALIAPTRPPLDTSVVDALKVKMQCCPPGDRSYPERPLFHTYLKRNINSTTMSQLANATLKHLNKFDNEIAEVVHHPPHQVALYIFDSGSNSWTVNPKPQGKLFLCSRKSNPVTYILVLLGRTESDVWTFHISPLTRFYKDDEHPRIDIDDSSTPDKNDADYFGSERTSGVERILITGA
eukprot:gene1391-4564_t